MAFQTALHAQIAEEAATLDADNVGALAREHFHIPTHNGRETAYFTGNSLGLQPRNTAAEIASEMNAWAALGVDGHFSGDRPWFHCHEAVSASLGRVVGASALETIAMGGLSNNLHLALVSFYRPTRERYRIVIESGAFPSDQYVVASHVAALGLDPADAVVEIQPSTPGGIVSEDDIEAYFAEHGHTVACTLFGGILFRTGQALDIERITQIVHKAGALAGFDLAHAVGNIPLHLHDWGVDFAAWCTYKYLNSGPGGIAGFFVHERHAHTPELPRHAGWWGHDAATRFEMGPKFVPEPGAAGWQLSNAPVLLMAALRASLVHFDRFSMQTLRVRSIELTGFVERSLDRVFDDRIEIVTPRDPARRGCQLSIRIPGSARAMQAALQEHGVITDFRPPDIIRVAPVPLYNSYGDIARFVEALDRVLDR